MAQEKFVLIANDHDREMAMVTSELIDTKVIGLLAAAIARTFEDIYESPMPIPNLMDCLTNYYNVNTVSKNDYPLKNMFAGEDMTDVVMMINLGEVIDELTMADVRSVLGVVYPSIKSYLNGQHGIVENFDEDWDENDD